MVLALALDLLFLCLPLALVELSWASPSLALLSWAALSSGHTSGAVLVLEVESVATAATLSAGAVSVAAATVSAGAASAGTASAGALSLVSTAVVMTLLAFGSEFLC